MQQQQYSTFKEFFRSIQILHGAMFMGLTLMMVVIKYLMVEEVDSQDDLIFPIIGVAAAMGGLFMGHLIFTKKVETIKSNNFTSMEKLDQYRTAFITKLALLEGPALICLVLHFIGGNSILFYTSVFMLVIFGLNRPLEDQIAQSLNIRSNELI